MGDIFNYPKFQAFDGSGNPLNAGKLYSYAAGGSTPKVTYSDKALSTPNANPTILDSRGEATIYLSGSYKFILKDSDDNIIWTLDELDSISPFANTGLKVLDTDASHYVTIKPGSDITANRILTITTGDANRALNITADLIVSAAATFDSDLTGGVKDQDNMSSDSATALATQQSIKAFVDYLRLGFVSRPRFVWRLAPTIFIEPGAYDVKGKMARWVTRLISPDIGTPTASTWVYLYLDYSAITSGTVITNAELIWSETAPSWTVANLGWYNGDDRCIFAVYSDAGQDITEFIHDGDLVLLADRDNVYASADVDTTWIDVTFILPAFTIIAIAEFLEEYVDGASSLLWRTNAQTGTTGHSVGRVEAGTTLNINTTDVITDTAGKIEVKHSASNGNKITVSQDGWRFPVGL